MTTTLGVALGIAVVVAIQLTGAIGYYSMLAMTVNACELEAAPGAEVLQV